MPFDPENPRKGFATVASKFFGKREGDSLQQFGDELKQLTDEDVAQLHEGITNGSLTY